MSIWVGIWNSLGWIYSELYDFKMVFRYNSRAVQNVLELRKASSGMMYSAGKNAGSIRSQSYGKYFDMGKVDEAWEHIVRYEQESAGSEFDMLRDRWSSRLKFLKADILLGRGDLDAAEGLARECLEVGMQRGYKKYVGKARRLIGAVLTEGRLMRPRMNLKSALERTGKSRQSQTDLDYFSHLAQTLRENKPARPCTRAPAGSSKGGTKNGRCSVRPPTPEGFLNAQPVREILIRAEQ